MKATLQLALEALDIVKIHYTQNRHVNEAITAIKEALAQPEHGWTPERIAGMARLKEAQDKKLAQPEQEPVAIRLSNGVIDVLGTAIVPIGTLLYTTPPQRTWVGLTPQERDEINEQVYGAAPHHVAFHHAIEAKLRSKNENRMG